MHKLFFESSCWVFFYHCIFISSGPKLGHQLNFYPSFQCRDKSNQDSNICHRNTDSLLVDLGRSAFSFLKRRHKAVKAVCLPRSNDILLAGPMVFQVFHFWRKNLSSTMEGSICQFNNTCRKKYNMYRKKIKSYLSCFSWHLDNYYLKGQTQYMVYLYGYTISSIRYLKRLKQVVICNHKV